MGTEKRVAGVNDPALAAVLESAVLGQVAAGSACAQPRYAKRFSPARTGRIARLGGESAPTAASGNFAHYDLPAAEDATPDTR